MRSLVILLAVGLAAGCGQAAVDQAEPEAAGPAVDVVAQSEATPVALIHALYAEPHIPVEAGTVRRYFTEEFVPGLTPPDDGPGPVGFDYRFSAQDADITSLEVVETAAGPEGSRVEVRFRNFGESRTVAWDLCRRPNGAWRILNASNREDSWSLRDLLELPAETAATC